MNTNAAPAKLEMPIATVHHIGPEGEQSTYTITARAETIRAALSAVESSLLSAAEARERLFKVGMKHPVAS